MYLTRLQWCKSNSCTMSSRSLSVSLVPAFLQQMCPHAGAQMVLTLKIISAAACYQDGAKPAAVGTTGRLALVLSLRRLTHCLHDMDSLQDERAAAIIPACP